jgi:transposase
MVKISTIGIDIAKNVFQVHAAGPDGGTVLCRRLRRDNVAEFFASIPPCLVGIEACGTSHHWAREIAAFGHDVRLMPPRYVRPYIKRNKNDAADAEAICEAVRRPNMRFVPVKTAKQQAVLIEHTVRDLLVCQRTRGRNRSTTTPKISLQRSNIPQSIIRFCIPRQPDRICDRDREFSDELKMLEKLAAR